MHFSHDYIFVTERAQTLKLDTFLSKNLPCVFSSPLQAPKNQGLSTFPFGEK